MYQGLKVSRLCLVYAAQSFGSQFLERDLGLCLIVLERELLSVGVSVAVAPCCQEHRVLPWAVEGHNDLSDVAGGASIRMSEKGVEFNGG